MFGPCRCVRALLVAAVVVALPFASAVPQSDERLVVANQVYPTECPTYWTPATVGCFVSPANATSVRVAAEADVGGAQPRMTAWVYDGNRLLETRWMCDDGDFAHANMTQLVVALEPDRDGCNDARLPLIAHGRLTATWS